MYREITEDIFEYTKSIEEESIEKKFYVEFSMKISDLRSQKPKKIGL